MKRRSAVFLCLVIVASAIANGTFFTPFPAFAMQLEAKIEGNISDPTGAKIIAARVVLQDASGKVISETQTDAQGRFAFAKVAAGNYEIIVEAAGFRQAEKTLITVKAGSTQTLNIRLKVAPITEKIDIAAINPVYSALRAAKPTSQYADVTNLVIKRDIATITLKQGQLFFIAPIENRITAAVFVGEGEIEVTPALDIERKNLSIYTNADSFVDQFSKMVLRFTDSTYEEISKQVEIKTGGSPVDAQKLFDNHRRMLRQGKGGMASLAGALLKYNLDGRILMDLLWQGKRVGLFNAYFDAKRYGDTLFTIDPLGVPYVNPEEVALVNFNETSNGVWVAEHLMLHYRSVAVFDESHQLLDFIHHKIDATMKGRRLEATVTTTYKSLFDGMRVLPFNLFERLRISKVVDEQNRSLNFIQEDKNEDGDLFVILAEPLKRGQEFSLTFDYAGDDAVDDSGGGNYTLVTRSNWYPNTANFGEDRATYEMTLRTAKDLMMVATGQPVSETIEGDKMVTRWKSDVPLAVAGFNYGNFKKSAVTDQKTKYVLEAYANKDIPNYLKDLQRRVDQAEQAGYTVEMTIGSLNTTSMMEKARAEAQIAVALYSDWFGDLPYGRLAMTQQPYPNFGQAWPMLVYMPLTAFLDTTIRQQLGMNSGRMSDFFKIVGPHEVAHQWWGHILGWKSYRDQWMSEGFSEFSASLYAQFVYKNNKFLDLWQGHRERIMEKNRMGKRPADVGSVYMGYRLNTPKTGNVARDMIYPKGAFILHMLRMMMWDKQTGDEKFFAMMKDFVKTHYNSNVSTQDFQRIVEKHMTADMDLDNNKRMAWFFGQWVYGSQIPDYKLDYKLEAADGGKTKLKFKITQSNVDEKFKMRAPIYLDYDGKLSRLGTVGVFGNSTTEEIEVLLPQKPKRVLLCAYEDVLCTTTNR